MTKIPLKDLKWAIAYHEAGHALAALSVGLPVKDCIIRANGKSGEQANDEPATRLVALTSLAVRHGEQDRIFVLMSGKAGESIYWATTAMGEPAANDTSREDIAMAIEIARELVSDEHISAMIAHHLTRSRDFFSQKRNADLLHRFAKRLFVKSRLTRAEMEAIIEKYDRAQTAGSGSGPTTGGTEHHTPPESTTT